MRRHHTLISLDNAAVVRAMEKIDFVLPGHSPEEIGALIFALVERAVGAGLTKEYVQRDVETIFDARAAALRRAGN